MDRMSVRSVLVTGGAGFIGSHVAQRFAKQGFEVRVLDDLPLTAGQRTRKRPLRDAGLGLSDAGGETLWLAPGQSSYVPLASGEQAQLLEAVREA